MKKIEAKGFTLIELTITLSVIAILITTLLPGIFEQWHKAKIRGAVEQARQVLMTCELARKKPISAVQDPLTLVVNTIYRPNVEAWTKISALDSMLTGDHYLPEANPLGRPYYFKMYANTCLVAVELDDHIDGWEGYKTEDIGSRTRIIVSTTPRGNASSAWVRNQKRVLSGELSR
tara:strand:+ start:8365 stop:8892 length:528 start_codon:yes stop_codon:yes gene_type:complete